MHRNEILTRINDGVIIALSSEVRQGRFLQKKEAAIRQLTFQRFITSHFSCIHYAHQNSWRCTVYKSYIVIFCWVLCAQSDMYFIELRYRY